MEKAVLDFVVEKTHDLMNAASCSSEAKTAAQAWLDALGTEKEAEETKKYIAELEADIMPIDSSLSQNLMPAHRFSALIKRRMLQHTPRRLKPQEQNTVTVRHVQPQKPYSKRKTAFFDPKRASVSENTFR